MNMVIAYRDLLEKRNYVRKADPRVNYWVDFAVSKISHYLDQYGTNFKLIIVGSLELEADFYAIPYVAVQDLLTEENLINDKSGNTRWICKVFGHSFKLVNRPSTRDIGLFYGNPILLNDENTKPWISLELSEEEQNDYSIENRKMEVAVRQKQSSFRKNVLKNFESKCSLTALTESNLLRASHIVPWSHRVDSRLDPSNGICLSVVYDYLFDQGFIGFNESLKVIITPEVDSFSEPLRRILRNVESKQAKAPILHSINKEYLSYHRERILIGA
jgi:hypothetical protein